MIFGGTPAVQNQIRADGLRVNNFSLRTITLMAEEWLAHHPELIAEAREKAASLGYC